VPLADIILSVQVEELTGGRPMNVRPDLQVSLATAQSIVDGVISGRSVAAVSSIHGGEIAAVYELAFVDAA
jgi:hypothetical protein